MPKINLLDVDDSKYEAAPAGRYVCQIINVEEKTSASDKNPGAPMVMVEFAVIAGEQKGKHFFQYILYETANGQARGLKPLLKATNRFDVDDPDLEFDWPDLIGAEVMVTVTTKKSEEYGESNNVKRVTEVADEDVDVELP